MPTGPRFAFRHFRTRLLAVILALVFALLGLVFVTVSVQANRSAIAASKEAMQVTTATLKSTMDTREATLRKFARLLSQDFAFKTLVSEGDHETILSAFKSYKRRLHAQWMFALNLEGKVMGDSLHPDAFGTAFTQPALVEAVAASETQETSSIQVIDGKAYQVVVVPLKAPEPISWVGIGFEITDFDAAQLEEQTHTRVTLEWHAAGQPTQLLASTLPEEERADYLKAAPSPAPHVVRVGGHDYVTVQTPLYETRHGNLVAGLQRSLDEALAGYYQLRRGLFAVAGVAAVLAVIAALLIARSVTRPVQRLAGAARRISAGHYEPVGDVGVRDEIGQLAASFDEMVRGLVERDQVRAVLGKVVSPAIAEELLAQRVDVQGQEREVTVLFSDIRGFTSLCEGRAPREILQMLNAYLGEVSAIVDAHGGVVDKYIGDAVMALFGAPLARPDDPERAVRAALAMLDALPALNARFEQAGWPPLKIGIGIHTGIAVAGNVGSETRQNYTVLGDTVNLASRLEGLCKEYDTPLIVSEATMARCPGLAFRELGTATVKGKAQAVRIYARAA
ncbi:MAG TPA: adenylate/guanylate cyclase domain-containing protein [Telluria sp.]|nr:adenylate/guanylate cyclase domain-containing protein [Telluria sp.]